MNFFEHQARARRRTGWLVGLFALALICIVALVDLVALLFFGAYHNVIGPDRYLALAESGGTINPFPFQIAPNRDLLIWTSLLTAGVIGLASQWRVLSLRGGGATVARGLGGTLVTAESTDPLRRRLRNVVEEMAIASGVPVPAIYVLEGEPGINAFAAGYSPADAAVAVTQGTLETLDRAELQGVVAHEFGHILNGDMRLNIRLMGWLFGILMLTLLGRFLLEAGRVSAQRKKGGVLSLGLALMVVGYVGVFFGRLIQASVSRQREFLADASAVQFTRQPSGLAGALKKIAAVGPGSRLQTDGSEVAHMLFASGLSSRLFATHPPLVERIRAIEPRFDPAELSRIAVRMERQTPAPEAVDPTLTTSTAPAAPGLSSLSPERIMARLGRPDDNQMAAAGRLAAAIPATLERAARTPEWSMAVIAYLLMSAEPEIRESQRLILTEVLGPESERQVDLLLRDVPELVPELRMPVLEIAFPALRRRPEPDRARLKILVERLIQADGRMSVFEYALARSLDRYLRDFAHPSEAQVAGHGTLSAATREVIDLLTIFAHQGRPQRSVALAALRAGIERLGAKPEVLARIQEDWFDADWLVRDWPARLDAALVKLARLRLADKQRLLGAMTTTVLADGRVAVAEMELLRAICATLRTPMPVLDLNRPGVAPI
ncbi:M48 family metallopeptidase [Allochromatium palmeri]|uniref:M48 family metalloprotease n=1 Tax=Allochromatium palmeri TaxID=231048 RepID=A0A6N8E817_9GAMM|nr:M48 family metallopeptidase [Allochromatium palmeri]MTW19488.1 M48 family metalloprotease [Allochromatium palmeri]